MQLHDLTAVEQAEAIRRREVSATELTEHYLQRCETLDGALGAFTQLYPEDARRQAEHLDHAFSNATDHEQLTIASILRGVVCPIKDLDDIAGRDTGWGTRAFQLRATEDSNVVRMIKDAGMIISGKTSVPEFGLPCYTEPDGLPVPRNPWNLAYTPSGSSGGAAVAVAAGLAPIAHGNDGGGSVRLPASTCGLVGVKPSRGRISNGPAAYTIGDLVTPGILARTVTDAAAMLDVLSVPMVGDPYRTQGPVASFLDALIDPAPLSIGFFTDPVVGQTPPTADVVAAVASTVQACEDLGHHLSPSPVPITSDDVGLFEILWASLAASQDFPADVEAQFTPLTRFLRQQGQDMSAGLLARTVSAIRHRAYRSMTEQSAWDVIICPTAAAPPFPIGSMRDDDDPAADFYAQKQWASYTSVYNVTGQPSVSIPAGWSAEGLPIGVQLVGRLGREDVVLSLARQLEQVRPWADRHPPMW